MFIDWRNLFCPKVYWAWGGNCGEANRKTLQLRGPFALWAISPPHLKDFLLPFTCVSVCLYVCLSLKSSFPVVFITSCSRLVQISWLCATVFPWGDWVSVSVCLSVCLCVCPRVFLSVCLSASDYLVSVCLDSSLCRSKRHVYRETLYA